MRGDAPRALSLSSALMLRAARSVLGLVCALACASTACGGATPEPCSALGACAEGQACIVGRCRPSDAALAPLGSRRVVLEATELAVLEPGGEPAPEAITPLGSFGREQVLLLLRFDPPAAAERELEAAFLVFDRDAAAPAEPTPIELELAAVLDPWSTGRVSWASRPRVGSQGSRFFAPAASDAPLRVEVTALLAERPSRDHGFALRALTNGAVGARLVTGPARGQTPRLELYLR